MGNNGDLLTAKEVQDLFKVDRITIYRMLKDGRLKGVKIGQQWRFARDQFEAVVAGERSLAETQPTTAHEVLPLHCLQSVQDVFADVAEVGSITTAPNGEPLTQLSNPSRFCSLILNSESGRRACIASWRQLAQGDQQPPAFASCHAGLEYACARVEMNGELVAVLVAGQFYVTPPIREEESARIRVLAETHGVHPAALAEAARELPTLNKRKEERIGKWLANVARTFQQVGCERAELMGRLKNIAQMSDLGSR